METLLLYLLKSGIVSGIFYLFYYLVLRRETFFRLNRFYLLGSLIFAYTFPFIRISFNTATKEALPVIINLQTTINQFTFTEDLPIAEEVLKQTPLLQHYWWLVLLLFISTIFLFRFLKHLFQLRKTIRANEKITQTNFTLVLFKQHITFSFFRYIFISHDVWRSPNGNSIINHELSHLKHKHSLDRLFLELMLLAFWMNPFIYLYRKDLEEVHEYQADNDATASSNSLSDYFKLVLQQSAKQSYSPLMSPFSYKLIKKRIKMSTHKSNPLKRILLAAPIVIAILIILSSSKTSSKFEILSDKQSHTISTNNQTDSIKVRASQKTLQLVTRSLRINVTSDGLINYMKSKSYPYVWNPLSINNKPGEINQVKQEVISFLNAPNVKMKELKEIPLLGKQQINQAPIFISGNHTKIEGEKVISSRIEKINQEVIAAYKHVKNQSSLKYYDTPYNECTIEEKNAIDTLHPQLIRINYQETDTEYKLPTFTSPIREKDLEKIASGYGMRIHPISKQKKMHKGIDYVAPLNTEILAVGDGTIRKVEHEFTEGKGYGKYVIIDHAEGYSSLYAQLNDYNVKEGQKVKQGDVIGFLGSSGISTGPHLHFEMMYMGQNSFDPQLFIK